jgi:hypothetical protein
VIGVDLTHIIHTDDVDAARGGNGGGHGGGGGGGGGTSVLAADRRCSGGRPTRSK